MPLIITQRHLNSLSQDLEVFMGQTLIQEMLPTWQKPSTTIGTGKMAIAWDARPANKLLVQLTAATLSSLGREVHL